MHILIIESKPERFRGHRLKLWRLGFKKEEAGKYVGTATSKWRIERIRRYCKEQKFKFRINNSYGNRSGSYRKTFLDNFPPNASRNRWHCAYCGKKVKAHKLEVDHLYPIYQASKSLKLQKHMRNQGISGVNAKENLVPACEKCNSKKGTKMGLWILRGKLGRHAVVWQLRSIAHCSFAFYLFVKSLENGSLKQLYNGIVSFLWVNFQVDFPVWH